MDFLRNMHRGFCIFLTLDLFIEHLGAQTNICQECYSSKFRYISPRDEWTNWSVCSRTCGMGFRKRTRICSFGNFQINCTVRGSCNLGECIVDGHWGAWQPWGSCSVTCGGGVRTRLRPCNAPPASNVGQPCSGQGEQSEWCYSGPCPVDGGWSSWSHWEMCTATCGGGVRFRNRTCNNPKPTNGGQNCEGETNLSKECNNAPCPVDGMWGQWENWDTCSVTCGNGIKTRARHCNNPNPSMHGKACDGDFSQSQSCVIQLCTTKLFSSEQRTTSGAGKAISIKIVDQDQKSDNKTIISFSTSTITTAHISKWSDTTSKITNSSTPTSRGSTTTTQRTHSSTQFHDRYIPNNQTNKRSSPATQITKSDSISFVTNNSDTATNITKSSHTAKKITKISNSVTQTTSWSNSTIRNTKLSSYTTQTTSSKRSDSVVQITSMPDSTGKQITEDPVSTKPITKESNGLTKESLTGEDKTVIITVVSSFVASAIIISVAVLSVKTYLKVVEVNDSETDALEESIEEAV